MGGLPLENVDFDFVLKNAQLLCNSRYVFQSALQVAISIKKSMDLALKMMNFVLQMMNFVSLKLTDFVSKGDCNGNGQGATKANKCYVMNVPEDLSLGGFQV